MTTAVKCKPIPDGCMWHPSGRAAFDTDEHYRTVLAEIILGCRSSRVTVDGSAVAFTGSWRLCRKCAKHPAFKRLRRVQEIQR